MNLEVEPENLEVEPEIMDLLLNDPELANPDDPNENKDQFTCDEEIQRLLCYATIEREEFLPFVSQFIKPQSFVFKAHQVVVDIAINHYKRHGEAPSWIQIVSEAGERLHEDKSKLYYLAEIKTLKDYYSMGGCSLAYLKDKLVQFARASMIKRATSKWLQKPYDEDHQKALAEATAFAQQISFDEPDQISYSLGDRLHSERPEWLISNLIRRNQISVIFGQPGCRKTWLALDLAVSVATGTEFLGSIPVKQGKVFYIISEGADDFELRAEALLRKRGISAPSGEQFQYRVVPYDFATDAAVNQCVKHISDKLGGADLIIVDTLSKNFSGDGDNNSEVGKYVNRMEQLRLQTGAHVLSIHHTGWANRDRERGGSNLRGGIDTSILVEKNDDHSTLICKKQKSGQEFDDIRVGFELVFLDDIQVDQQSASGLVGYVDEGTTVSDLEQIIRQVFNAHDEINQRDLVKQVRSLWRDSNVPGEKKIRQMIKDLEGSILISQKGENNAIIYRMIGGNLEISGS